MPECQLTGYSHFNVKSLLPVSFSIFILACIKSSKMLAYALLNELFNVFPILFHVEVCVGAMLSFQKRKRVTI